MNWLFMVASLLLASLFPETIDRALTLSQAGDWPGAAAALDQAAIEDPALFNVNGLPYLRGRIAESQSDWQRARSEFLKIGINHPLRPLAAWHAAMSSARLQDFAAIGPLLSELPADFPAEYKMQLARLGTTDLAIRIYASMSTRESKFERARIHGDRSLLWSLLRERKDDDIGLECAHLLAPSVSTAKEMVEIADAFLAHRQFAYARPLYEMASQDSSVAAESRYQIARIQFLQEDFRGALQSYTEIAKDFAGSKWEMDSDYQIASCYWRLGEFRDSEKAYSHYLSRYGRRGNEEGVIRNLVDVYRVLGENSKALTWLDRALAKRTSIASRQVLLFTKAKILYTLKRFTASAQLFGQLARSSVRSAPGGTTKDEARYFQALSLSRAGNSTAARTIWRSLAAEPLSYYGALAADKLERTPIATETNICRSPTDPVLSRTLASLAASRRPLITSMDTPPSDATSELMFLQLWDEASLTRERSGSRPDTRISAELAYASGRYHRAIAYADRLPKSDPTILGLLYPAGFRSIICAEAAKNNIDPLWLHSIIWQESKYNPYARSGASARGLMQFIPETAIQVGTAIGIPEFSLNKLYDPAVNIPMGAHYWSTLMKELKSPVMALAAYNGGIDNVRRWKNKFPEGDDEFFVADIGFVETKRYVIAVYGAKVAYSSQK